VAFGGAARELGRAVLALAAFYAAVGLGVLPMYAAVAQGLIGRSAASVAFPAWVAAVVLFVNGQLVRRRLTTWGDLGWRGPRPDASAFGSGAAIGAAMAAGAVVLAVVLGSAAIVTTGEPLTALAGVALRLVVFLGLAALVEELLFRGYPLARLARALGRAPASLAFAIVFAAVHLGNPAVSAFGLVNIGLASLVLSAAFFAPGGLPLAWGVHFGWNAGLAIADAPVSGLSFDLPGLDFVTGAPAWVTGGAFGPEGGVVASVVMLIALAVLVRSRVGDPREEMTPA
jgi:hypothetical protein